MLGKAGLGQCRLLSKQELSLFLWLESLLVSWRVRGTTAAGEVNRTGHAQSSHL